MGNVACGNHPLDHDLFRCPKFKMVCRFEKVTQSSRRVNTRTLRSSILSLFNAKVTFSVTLGLGPSRLILIAK